jgi:hypothetical protein
MRITMRRMTAGSVMCAAAALLALPGAASAHPAEAAQPRHSCVSQLRAISEVARETGLYTGVTHFRRHPSGSPAKWDAQLRAAGLRTLGETLRSATTWPAQYVAVMAMTTTAGAIETWTPGNGASPTRCYGLPARG